MSDWTGNPTVLDYLRSHGVLEEADKVFNHLDTIEHLANLCPCRVMHRMLLCDDWDGPYPHVATPTASAHKEPTT